MKSIVYLFVEDLDVWTPGAKLSEDYPRHWFTASFVAEVPELPLTFAPKTAKKMEVTGVSLNDLQVRASFAGKAVPVTLGSFKTPVEFLPSVCLKVSAYLSCNIKRRQEFADAVLKAFGVPDTSFVHDGMPEGGVFFEYGCFKPLSDVHGRSGHERMSLRQYSLYTIPE